MSDISRDAPSDLPSVDLSECEAEPIHLLELVQGHGCLLVAGGPALTILQISDNAQDILGVAASDLLGLPLSRVLDDLSVAGLEALRTDPRRLEATHAGLYGRSRDPVSGVARLRITAHRRSVDGSGGGERTADEGREGPVPDPSSLVIELEPIAEKDEDAAEETFEAESIALASLTEGENLFQLLNQSVEAIAGLTDYDRVMAYMFHEDWSGEVVAECCHPDMTPFLGLRYPASDIPSQARRLYLSQLLRVIVDVDGLNVPMVRSPSASDQPPLDLGGAILRSVSPYHIEYLRNMGVKATLVASLVVDGALWGLIACHHNSRKVVPWHRREAVGHVAARLSDRITDVLSLQRTRIKRRSKRYLGLLSQSLAGSVNPIQALVFENPRLTHLLRCQGVAVSAGGCTVTGAEAPPVTVIPELLERAASKASAVKGAGTVFESHDLAGDPLFEGLALGPVCGMVAVFPTGNPHLALACFRGEVVREVHWGGDPNKPAEVDAASQRLSPRKSFNLWRQVVRGQSSPWEAWAIGLLQAIGGLLVEQAVGRGSGEGALDGGAAGAISSSVAEFLAGAMRAQMAWFEATARSRLDGFAVADSGVLLVEVSDATDPDSGAGAQSTPDEGRRERSGAERRIVAANQAFCACFDVDEMDVCGETLAQMLMQAGLPKTVADLPPGGDMDVEWWSGALGHRTLQVHRRGLFAGHDSSGVVQGRSWVTYAFSDVTNFYRTRIALGVARDQAQARSRGRTEFLARLARELRGPLQAIQGYAALLEHDEEGGHPDRYRAFAHEVGNHSGTLLNVLNNLLDLSRLDQGREGAESRCFDLTSMTAEVCQQAVAIADRCGLTWDWHIPNERILLQGDEDALRRAFLTLIHKAIMVSPAGASVSLRLTMERGGEPRLSVTDMGLGLRDDELIALQRPMEMRPDDGALEDDDLGSVALALVRGLIDLHGGAIVVTSNPGSGTTINVTLPRHRVVTRDNATLGPR